LLARGIRGPFRQGGGRVRLPPRGVVVDLGRGGGALVERPAQRRDAGRGVLRAARRIRVHALGEPLVEAGGQLARAPQPGGAGRGGLGGGGGHELEEEGAYRDRLLVGGDPVLLARQHPEGEQAEGPDVGRRGDLLAEREL